MARPLLISSSSVACISVAAAVLLGGCVERILLAGADTDVIDDEEPVEDEEPIDDDGPVDDEEPIDDDGPIMRDLGTEPSECFDVFLQPERFPVSLSGTTGQGVSRVAPACVSADAPETIFALTATRTGIYTFDTFGSGFDTILYVLSGECLGEVLGCNDDIDDSVQSRLEVALSAGQTVSVVLDGFNTSGDWVLNVSGEFGVAACDTQPLPSSPNVVVDGILDDAASDSVDPSCAPDGGDVVYSYVPPFSGPYLISTDGSDFDTVLSIYDENCLQELACNDDVGSVQAALTAELEEGVPVTIGLDAFNGGDGGFYVLEIFAL